MENPLRIGNDANFEWSVKKIVGDEKVPYDLTGRNLQLFLVGRVDRIEVTDFVVNGNVIMWTFYGKDQRHTGIYNALLVENMGEERMVTVDIQYAVTLVPHSWIITGEDGDGCVTMDTIYLESAFTMEPGPRGYSAYEVAVQQGYVGTVDEWLDSLVGFSPVANVVKEGDIAMITITDLEGTTTATVRDGSDADVTKENIEEALGGAPVMTETDPTVPDWAKAANKPSYTANEVGALPDDTPIPSVLSDLSDVAATAPSDGQALIWDNTAGTWKPGAAGSPDTVKYTVQTLTAEQQAQARTNIGAGTYSKPNNGIPASDLASGVIPDVSGFYVKPASGIPASDLASGVIPDVSSFITKNVNDLTNYYTKSQTHTKQEIAANYWPKSDVVNIELADVAVSGDWDDLLNNPIPTPSASDNGKVLGVTDAQGTLGWVEVSGSGSGSVISVGLSVPTGLEVSGSPITDAGTLAVTFQNGYSIPTDAKQTSWDAKYDKPSGGIPATDLASAVQTSLGKADSALQTETDPVFSASPAAGIAASDITAWNGKYTKPAGGIPATDLASGVIPEQTELTQQILLDLWTAAS